MCFKSKTENLFEDTKVGSVKVLKVVLHVYFLGSRRCFFFFFSNSKLQLSRQDDLRWGPWRN